MPHSCDEDQCLSLKTDSYLYMCVVLQSGETVINEDCTQKCSCVDGVFSCENTECPEEQVCEIREEVRNCHEEGESKALIFPSTSCVKELSGSSTSSMQKNELFNLTCLVQTPVWRRTAGKKRSVSRTVPVSSVWQNLMLPVGPWGTHTIKASMASFSLTRALAHIPWFRQQVLMRH